MATNGDSPVRSRESNDYDADGRRNSLIRRSWHAMSEVLSPFSPSALASLPKRTFPPRARYTRTDNVPEAEQGEDGQMPTVRDYHAINSLPPQVRVPKKIATPVKVEGKVWFANERSMSLEDLACLFLYSFLRVRSMGFLPEHRHSDRDPFASAIQRFERSSSKELCVYLCCHQRGGPGAHRSHLLIFSCILIRPRTAS